MRLLSWLALIALSASPAFALTTAYVSFDHPDGWGCELSQGVWICQSNSDLDRRDAVILSIATLATEWDTLENYEQYLKQPRTIQDEQGNTLTANVSYTRRRNINGVTWVDSLQHNSELPGFWARYLATVHVTGQTKLAILITYIVSDDKYQKFAPQFERMVGSLKPNDEFDMNVASKQGDGPLPGSTRLGQVESDLIAKRLGKKKTATKTEPEAPPAQPSSPMMPIATVVGGGGIVYYILRRRRKTPPPRNNKRPPGSAPGSRPPARRA